MRLTRDAFLLPKISRYVTSGRTRGYATRAINLRISEGGIPQVRPAKRFPPKPAWAGALHGNQVADASNAGTRSGNGAGNGNGSGADAPSGDQPCGFVTFSDPHGSRFDPQTHGFWVDIKMSVHFADGSLQSLLLDYPWYYPSESANPWSNQNLRDPAFPMRFQPPPSGKLLDEPPLVQYVIAHSTPDGMTILKDCPTAAPPPGN